MNRRTVLLAALTVSLALNLLIAGIFIGRMGGRPHGPPPGAWAARDLSPETRRIVRDHMRRDIASVRPLRAEMVEARAAVRRVVLDEAFDAQALRAALAQVRAVGDRYEELLHENLVEVAGQLPAEERAALVRAALDRAGPGGRERPRRPEPPGR